MAELLTGEAHGYAENRVKAVAYDRLLILGLTSRRASL
jgi:hypothetical protein